MRILLSAAIVALFFVPAFADSTWAEFRDPQGAFTVEFPGPPDSKIESTDTAIGQAVATYEYSVSNATAEKLVMVGDYSRLTGDYTLSLDGAVAGISKGRTVISDVVVSLDGYAGRFVTLTDSDGLTYTDRVFLIGKFMYQVITVASKGGPQSDTDDNARFSESIHFLPQ